MGARGIPGRADVRANRRDAFHGNDDPVTGGVPARTTRGDDVPALGDDVPTLGDDVTTLGDDVPKRGYRSSQTVSFVTNGQPHRTIDVDKRPSC
jgi:hypothetical protein